MTGASAGFGRLIVEALRKQGHVVVASMRGVAGRNREAAVGLASAGAHVVEIDVTDDQSVESGVAEALACAGGRRSCHVRHAAAQGLSGAARLGAALESLLRA